MGGNCHYTPQDQNAQVLDFVTKAVPNCFTWADQDQNRKWKRMDFPNIGAPLNLEGADKKNLDKYYSTINKKGFLDRWNSDNGFQLNLYKRIRSIAYIAWMNGYDNIVLGPIGCGAFGHDPRVVATVFYHVFVKEFRGVFEHIEFACMTFCPRDEFTYAIFEKHFVNKANEFMRKRS